MHLQRAKTLLSPFTQGSIRKYSIGSSSKAKKRNLIAIGLGVAGCGGVVSYLYLNNSTTENNINSNPTSNKTKDAMNNQPSLSQAQVDSILKMNELSILNRKVSASKKALGNDRTDDGCSHGDTLRIDFNQVASNNPIEDMYFHVDLNKESPSSSSSSSYSSWVNQFFSSESKANSNSSKKTEERLLFGIFDGHSGKECSTIVSLYLHHYIAHALKSLPPNPSTLQTARRDVQNPNDQDDDEDLSTVDPVYKQKVMDCLQSAFKKLDNDIINGALPILPTTNPTPSFFSKTQIQKPDVQKIASTLRSALSGSCGLVLYKEGRDLYVACTGDSRAVLGRRRLVSGVFEAFDLSYVIP
jgi:serine/threonine protein phosphatase PrpC